MELKLSLLLHVLVVAIHAPLSIQAALPSGPVARGQPTRVIAGVSVIDTPIVRAAQNYARTYASDFLYKHVVRSWLLGTLIVQHNETLSQSVDLEAHAIAALLHDLGIIQGSPFISPDRRFEVDGAFAATDFIKSHAQASDWDQQRLQLVWDGIALHSEHAISKYKEPTVAAVTNGVWAEFLGTGFGITSDEYNAVYKAFPNSDLAAGFNASMVSICQNKAATTYDTWQEPFGEHFVHGYSALGYKIFDLVNP